nr:unnamed protein product [Callosobruchus chinensis]
MYLLTTSKLHVACNNSVKIVKNGQHNVIAFTVHQFVNPHSFVESKPYKCSQCNRSYKHSSHLSRHIRNECGREPQHRCGQCLYATNRKDSLSRHVLLVHLKGRMHQAYDSSYQT